MNLSTYLTFSKILRSPKYVDLRMLSTLCKYKIDLASLYAIHKSSTALRSYLTMKQRSLVYCTNLTKVTKCSYSDVMVRINTIFNLMWIYMGLSSGDYNQRRDQDKDSDSQWTNASKEPSVVTAKQFR